MKLDGYQWVIVLGILCVSIVLVLIVKWLKALIIQKIRGQKESAAGPIKASENGLHQHLKKSHRPGKNHNDQVMIGKGKKEKNLYLRLRDSLSKDRVGQSFIIVRGGQIIKPQNGTSKACKAGYLVYSLSVLIGVK